MKNPDRSTIDKEAAQLKRRFDSIKNRAQFARDFDLSGGSSMIYQHIKGIKPISLDAAMAYARGFNVPLSDISERLASGISNAATKLSSTPITTFEEKKEEADSVLIPKRKLKVRAGISGFETSLEEEDVNPIWFRKDWMTAKGYEPESLIAILITDDSMEPSLYAGDTIVVNTLDKTLSDGKVFVVNYEGSVIVRRLIRDLGKWWLSSDNQDKRKYPHKEYSGDYCIIIGRVIHKQSDQI